MVLIMGCSFLPYQDHNVRNSAITQYRKLVATVYETESNYDVITL